MREHVNLTRDNIKDVNPENLIAVTIAEGGAMGDPGAIELVDKELKIYYTHFGIFERSELERIIPFLKTLDIGFGEISGLAKDWVGLYAGYGNYLFVRPKYEKPILKYIDDNYSNTKMPKVVELYGHWYEALRETVGKENG